MRKVKNVITIIFILMLIICSVIGMMVSLSYLSAYGTKVTFIVLRVYVYVASLILLMVWFWKVCEKSISLKVNEMLEKTITPEKKKISAYHEAGHALVGKIKGINIHKVSILPDEEFMVDIINEVDKSDSYITKSYLNNLLVMLFAGREAEIAVFNENSTQCINDIEEATNIAKKMVTLYGMTNNLISFVDFDTEDIQQFGPDICNKIGGQIEALLNEARLKATEIIRTEGELFEKIAKALIEKETISGEELEEIWEED